VIDCPVENGEVFTSCHLPFYPGITGLEAVGIFTFVQLPHVGFIIKIFIHGGKYVPHRKLRKKTKIISLS